MTSLELSASMKELTRWPSALLLVILLVGIGVVVEVHGVGGFDTARRVGHGGARESRLTRRFNTLDVTSVGRV